MIRAKNRRLVKLETGNKFVKFRGYQRGKQGHNKFDRYHQGESSPVRRKRLSQAGKKNFTNQKRHAGRNTFNSEPTNRESKNRGDQQNVRLQKQNEKNNKKYFTCK